MSEFVAELTDEQFKNEVASSKMPVMVDFWASWCGPCKMMAPVVEEAAREYKGKIKIVKINVEDNQKIASELGVMNIPTIIFFKNGKEASRFSGAVPKKELNRRIEKAIGA